MLLFYSWLAPSKSPPVGETLKNLILSPPYRGGLGGAATPAQLRGSFYIFYRCHMGKGRFFQLCSPPLPAWFSAVRAYPALPRRLLRQPARVLKYAASSN